MSHSEYALHLWSMTTGQPHPAAENPILSYPRTSEINTEADVYSVSITNSRLAVLIENRKTGEGVKMVVWDWRTGNILLVSEPLFRRQPPIGLKFGDRTAEIGVANS
jgi:hypothetical protein